ncbi:C45 family peptidase [Lactobacillus sp. YT155]|uniref:carcinine hydrolase/isopenicillin-N N-acyltransferase family protein n=1 Tax=Lactobacillus sp. YT155 TaxID=3060955 RepID=UPI00265EF76D|nr:C45 family peptidase [Lactobacillus sp. YT155]MDO1605319.1 C45 family peptidase [Lactobacillus sp. YT155]
MKILKRVLLSLLALILIVVAGIGFMFRNEISTISNIKQVDKYPFYEMTYKGDYGFDDFLKEGASNDTELVQFVSKKLLKGLPLNIKVPDLGCATFTARTPDNQKVFGRNFDLDYSPSMLVHTNPDKGYKSISMVNLAFLGFKKETMNNYQKRILALAAPYIPLDGVNEKGLSVGVLLLDDKPTDQKTSKVDINTTTAIRLMLDKAKNVDEAVKLLKKYDMHSSANSTYHFHIADASGKSVVVEYVNNKMKLVQPTKNYQYATNFYLSPEKNKMGKGFDRYAVLEKTLDEKKGIMTSKDSMNLLESVHVTPEIRKKGIFKSKSDTQWSGVYNLTKKSLNVSIDGNYKKVYHFKVK